jgi:hypothetical protein
MDYCVCLLALFTGLASAQVDIGGAAAGGPLTCNASVAVPPQLRAEGYTELIGDIVITCTGGAALAEGSTIPTANITVSLGTAVTSTLLATGNVSEALLLIDEPGSGVGGAGTLIPQAVCSSAALGAGPGGCTQTVPAVGTAVPVNVFQGIVNSNQVIFNGIPILPPASAGQGRVYRITNVRANVAGLGGGGLAGTSQLIASISISGSTSLPINNPIQIAGFIQNGLTTAAPSASFAQCGGGNSPSSITSSGNPGLRFSEGFATAFKTRVAPTSTHGGQAGAPPAVQNVPGNIYNSESGFITGAVPGAGLANYGTRLKAVFNNVPSTVRIFVTTNNINNVGVANAPTGALVISETATDANDQAPLASSTRTVSGVAVAELPVVNGTATAVWEVLSASANAQENLVFGVYQQFSANPGANLPTPGTGTVNLSFAPTPTAAFSASSGAAASSTLPVPRFADTSTAANIITINLCQTALLFPFVTSAGGFDTGIAIANTTTDPFGTRNQSGTCTLNFYGASPNPTPFTTASVATGTVYSDLVSARAGQNFTGYMIALCNFQLAHGFAFVSDIGARNLAMGYLALVLPDIDDDRNNRTETLDN